MSKENGDGERMLPPIPPNKKEGEGKESPTPSRIKSESEKEVLPAVIDIHNPPSLELLLVFAHKRLRFRDDEFIKEWHRQMNEVYFWCYPKTGQPIRHWPAYLRSWIREHKRDLEKEKYRQERAKQFAARRKPDNYLAPIKEENDVKPF